MSETNGDTGGKAYVPVRDKRGRAWWWAHNLLYDPIRADDGEITTFAAVLGPGPTAIYGYLARLADEETQTCFPAYPTIAFVLGISEPVATDGIHLLVDHGLIARQHRVSVEGDPTSNMYVLLPPENWTLGGGKAALLPPRLKNQQAKRRDNLRERKVPRGVAERAGGGKPALPRVGNVNGHPSKATLLGVVNPLNHPSQADWPPFYQSSEDQTSDEKDQHQNSDPPAGVVVEVDFSNSQTKPSDAGQPPALISALAARVTDHEHGVNQQTAAQLAAQFPENLARQLELWPYRPEVRAGNFKVSRGAFFVSCVRRNYEAPAAWDKAQEAVQRAQQAREAEETAQERNAAHEAAQRAADARMEAEAAQLDALWASGDLDEAARQWVSARVQTVAGDLASAVKSETQRAALERGFVRAALREYLAQVAGDAAGLATAPARPQESAIRGGDFNSLGAILPAALRNPPPESDDIEETPEGNPRQVLLSSHEARAAFLVTLDAATRASIEDEARRLAGDGPEPGYWDAHPTGLHSLRLSVLAQRIRDGVIAVPDTVPAPEALVIEEAA